MKATIDDLVPGRKGSTVVHLVDRAPHPVGGNEGIADWMHNWADCLASGDYGDIVTIAIVVERSDGRIAKISQATKPLDHARFIGLLHLAAHRCADGACDIERLTEND